jgi:predicted nucleotidyltransferase
MRITKEQIISFLSQIKHSLVFDGISEVALFGSFARGDAGVYSDIDIAIKKDEDYLKNKTAYDYFEQVAQIKKAIRDRFHRNSDIFDLDSKSSMKNSITKDLIYV